MESKIDGENDKQEEYAQTKDRPDSFNPYRYVTESNCLKNVLETVCFATQNLVGTRLQRGHRRQT